MWQKKKNEEELLEGIIRADVSSYDAVYRHWFPILRSFIFGMLKDWSRAEDVAQNVLMKLWVKRGSLDKHLSLKNYLFVLTKNEIFNILKSAAHKSLSYTDTLPDDRIPDSGTEDSIALSDTETLVSTAIMSLPQKRREVFIMSRYEHMNTEEIADKLRISPRTVEKHLELALKDLRKNLN